MSSTSSPRKKIFHGQFIDKKIREPKEPETASIPIILVGYLPNAPLHASHMKVSSYNCQLRIRSNLCLFSLPQSWQGIERLNHKAQDCKPCLL